MNNPDLRAGARKRVALDPARLHRLPPHSLEAEQGVLGCAVLGGDAAVADVVAGCSPDSFYDLRNRTVFEAVAEMRDRRAPVDLLTLHDKLKASGQLEAAGGLAYLMSLPNAVPSEANLPYYLTTLAEKTAARKLIETCRAFAVRSYSYDGDFAVLVDEFEREALKVRGALAGDRSGPADLKKVQQELIADYEAAMQRGVPTGLLTGFADLDHKCAGLCPKELVVVGGKPSSGKTTLALNVAVRVAQGGTKVAFYSLETSAKKLAHRIQCLLAPVDGGGFRRGQVSEAETAGMMRGVDALAKCRHNLLIYDFPMTDAGLAAAARADWQRGARLFVVDYLQLVEAKGDGAVDRTTNASKALKRMAQELDCPVLVVSSLNRKTEGKPTIANLRESGQIDFDADKIWLLSTDGTEDDDVREVCCDVAKNKDGPKGDVSLTLFAAQFRFESAARCLAKQL